MSERSLQAQTIHQLLEDAEGPMSANELWMASQGQGIGIATVYRTLKRGVESGELCEATLPGGQTRYEPANLDHHHHFLCSDCERAIDLSGCVPGLDSILPSGFTMTNHEILLFGQCSTCNAA